MSSLNTYPKQYMSKVVLKDGSTCLLRPIRTDDVDGWLEFYNSLSERTRYLRSQTLRVMNRDDAVRFCAVDYVNSFAFVAEAIENQKKRIVAIGRYNRLPSDTTAEISFVIEDVYQEKGIGTKLIEWLAMVGRKNYIDTFEAYVLQENRMMMSVFQGYGFHMKKETKDNMYYISFPLTKTPEVMKKKEERYFQSTLKSLDHILKPKSIAVIGASNKPGSIGQQVFQSLIQNGFSGVVYPVSPSSGAVMAVKAYKSVLDTPGEVEMAVIVVPAAQVVKVVDECGRKKVNGIIVISDGFRERGAEGEALELKLREIAFGYGMRIVGPNCMGVINTDPKIRMNATFALLFPPEGNIAFISQSGALGLGILQYAKKQNIGFSSYISVGNRADIAATDMLQYWEKDPATKVILLYLESFDNPEYFSRISKRVASKKPIIAVKGGTTAAGSRATMSHTGAMATPGNVSEALLYQAGIVRVNTIEDMFHTAMLLANQPVPAGRRVAILTNGGGPGTLAADACANNGLVLHDLSDEIRNKLKAVVKRDIGLHNPLDLTAGVSAKEFEDSLKILAEDPDNDAIITIYVPPAGLNINPIEDAINNAIPAIKKSGKPVLACFVGEPAMGKAMDENQFIPYYIFPEDAARSLANAAKYGEMKRKDHGSARVFEDIKKTKSVRIINRVLTENQKRPIWVQQADMSEIFKSYGIHFAETRIADSEKEAASIAKQLGFPVAVKLNSSTISHKSDVGGVILDVNSEAEAEKAFRDIRASLEKLGRGSEMQGVSIQHMVNDGVEVIVGVTEDATLGHVIMFGLGGIYAELINDTALRLNPLTDHDASEMINSVKMIELLKGYRGSVPLDIKSLEDLLLRISVLVENIPHITEMDLNPVKVLPEGKGYCVVDARIMIK